MFMLLLITKNLIKRSLLKKSMYCQSLPPLHLEFKVAPFKTLKK